VLFVAYHSALAAPPILDEVDWLDDLTAARPNLVAKSDAGIYDPAYAALVIRPAYREEIRTSTATYASIVAREYTADARKEDDIWATSLRDAQRRFRPHRRSRVASYALEAYTGYAVGDGLQDENGVTYKVFLEVKDHVTTLSAASWLGFVDALDTAGFVGDTKIDLRPGVTRFRYNDVIVHAPSIAAARCAEAVGVAYFGAAILHVARGIDPPPSNGPIDWHHFLLTGAFGKLPRNIQDFVRYVGPDATATCG
jgi:hypothetical protein